MLPDFENRDGTIWLDGEFVPWREARLHVLSHSLHFASAVFEGLRVYDGKIFKLSAHTHRLIESARLVDFEIPFGEGQINTACEDIVRRQEIVDGYIRPVAWRGSGSMAPTAMDAPIHLAIATWEWPVYYSEDAKKKGIRLAISDWRRPPPDSAPTQSKASGLYQICTLAKHAAERKGYDDALMLCHRGYVAETTSSNVFFVFDGALHTPTADCFLDGITRQIVMGLADGLGLETVERYIELPEIAAASEVFITGTAAEITPVGEIAERMYNCGPVTDALMARFGELIRPG